MKVKNILEKNYKVANSLDLSMGGNEPGANSTEYDYENILNEIAKVYQLSLSKGLSVRVSENISVELFKRMIYGI